MDYGLLAPSSKNDEEPNITKKLAILAVDLHYKIQLLSLLADQAVWPTKDKVRTC
jgi:hypothetical protein